jgi:mRNA interferase MazF
MPSSGPRPTLMAPPMRRGDIYWVDLEPARATEADKVRPAVLVSNDAANRTAERLGRGVVTMVPLTSSTRRIYPYQVLVPSSASGLAEDSKAQAEQVRSVSTARLRNHAGRLPAPLLADLDRALMLHLGLSQDRF